MQEAARWSRKTHPQREGVKFVASAPIPVNPEHRGRCGSRQTISARHPLTDHSSLQERTGLHMADGRRPAAIFRRGRKPGSGGVSRMPSTAPGARRTPSAVSPQGLRRARSAIIGGSPGGLTRGRSPTSGPTSNRFLNFQATSRSGASRSSSPTAGPTRMALAPFPLR